jgi:hypothetical protein
LGRVGRVYLIPELASPSTVLGIALAPSVVAGLIIFRAPAVAMLAVALGVGLVAHVGAAAFRQPMQDSPALASLIGVALVGSNGSILWAVVVAVLAAALELIRVRVAPTARIHMGLLAYAVVLIASMGHVADYINPATGLAQAEPIRLGRDIFGAARDPFDPIRLYVGNVPGPVFATSMLGVVLGAAWLWYARRLSPLTLVMFSIGVLIPTLYMRWSIPYQLTSGPLWFVGALLLADRRYLPNSLIGRPLLGLCAGMLALTARTRGYGIEATFVAVAGLQLAIAMVESAAVALGRPGPTNGHRAFVLPKLPRLRLPRIRVPALRQRPGAQPTKAGASSTPGR